MRHYLLLFFLGTTLWSQAQDDGSDEAYFKVGAGWNLARYTNNNNLKAFSYYLNLRNSSNGRTLLEKIDLTKFQNGIAFNAGLDKNRYSFFVEWHNAVLKDALRYEETSPSGATSIQYQGFKFNMNSFSISAAYGIKQLKIGGSVDLTHFKYSYKEDASSTNWLRQNKMLNAGVTAFLEINPVRFIKIKPYVQMNAFRNSFKNESLALPQYELSMNFFSNFGVCTFIQFPYSLK